VKIQAHKMDSQINVVWVALQEMEMSGRCVDVQEKTAGGVRNFSCIMGTFKPCLECSMIETSTKDNHEQLPLPSSYKKD